MVLVFQFPQVNIQKWNSWVVTWILSSEVVVTGQLAWIDWLHLMNINHEAFLFDFLEGKGFCCPFPVSLPSNAPKIYSCTAMWFLFMGHLLEIIWKHYFSLENILYGNSFQFLSGRSESVFQIRYSEETLYICVCIYIFIYIYIKYFFKWSYFSFVETPLCLPTIPILAKHIFNFHGLCFETFQYKELDI